MNEVLYTVKVSISREIRENGKLVKAEKIFVPLHLHAFKSLRRAVQARDYLFGSKLIQGKLETINE